MSRPPMDSSLDRLLNDIRGLRIKPAAFASRTPHVAYDRESPQLRPKNENIDEKEIATKGGETSLYNQPVDLKVYKDASSSCGSPMMSTNLPYISASDQNNAQHKKKTELCLFESIAMLGESNGEQSASSFDQFDEPTRSPPPPPGVNTSIDTHPTVSLTSNTIIDACLQQPEQSDAIVEPAQQIQFYMQFYTDDGPNRKAPNPPVPPVVSEVNSESSSNVVEGLEDQNDNALNCDLDEGPMRAAPPPPPTTLPVAITPFQEHSAIHAMDDDGPKKAPPPPPQPIAATTPKTEPIPIASEPHCMSNSNSHFADPDGEELCEQTRARKTDDYDQFEDGPMKQPPPPPPVTLESDEGSQKYSSQSSSLGPETIPKRHNDLDLPPPNQVFRARVHSLNKGDSASTSQDAGGSICKQEGCSFPAGPKELCLMHFVESVRANWSSKEKSAVQEARRQSVLRGTLLPGGQAPRTLEALLEAVSTSKSERKSQQRLNDQMPVGSSSKIDEMPAKATPRQDEDVFVRELSEHYAYARASVIDNAPVKGIDIEPFRTYLEMDDEEDEEEDGSEGEGKQSVLDQSARTKNANVPSRPPSSLDGSSVREVLGSNENSTPISLNRAVSAAETSENDSELPSNIVKPGSTTMPNRFQMGVFSHGIKKGSNNSKEGQAALYLRGGSSRQLTPSIREMSLPFPHVAVSQHSSVSPSPGQLQSGLSSPMHGPSSPRADSRSINRLSQENSYRSTSSSTSSRSLHSPLSEYDPQWQRQVVTPISDTQILNSAERASVCEAQSTTVTNNESSQIDNLSIRVSGLGSSRSDSITKLPKKSPYESWRIAYAVSRAKQTVSWTSFVQGLDLKHSGLGFDDLNEEKSTCEFANGKDGGDCAIVLGHPVTSVRQLERRIRSKKGIPFARDGFPIRTRPLAWISCLGAYEQQLMYGDYYATCIVQLEFQATRSYVDIVKDVKRTMQYHPLFQTEEGTKRLTNVLGTFSFKNPRIGYCQSMNIIAATLMLFYSEEETFWMLDALVEQILPIYYLPTMIGVRTDLAVFESLVESRLPHLAKHFATHSVLLSSICVSWFMCLFVEVLPLESSLRVWDVLLAESSCAILFRVALAILNLASKEILQASNAGEIISLLSQYPSSLFDCDSLLKLAHEKTCYVSESEVKKLRLPILDALEREHLNSVVFLKHD